MNSATVLGIDPGYARCGWGVINAIENQFNLVDFGTIETDREKPFASRLGSIYHAIVEIVAKYSPTLAGVEILLPSGTLNYNLINVAEARGVILLAIADAHISVQELMPGEVKRRAANSWIAGKKEVEAAVRAILRIPSSRHEHDDAFDALAIAICAARYS